MASVMSSIITGAYVVVNPEAPETSWSHQCAVDVVRIYRGVQGNKPSGAKMSDGDKLLMIEAALRRGIAIIDEARAAGRIP
jgi:hypothetical protein